MIVFVFGLIQLLQLVTMHPVAAVAVGDDDASSKSSLEEAVAVFQTDDDGGGSDARRAPAMDVGDQAELVSRRRLYGDQSMPWNNQDMAWLKREDEIQRTKKLKPLYNKPLEGRCDNITWDDRNLRRTSRTWRG